jgi:raffinose/stachyose/melibiose transport system substrate-binding protein
MSTPNIRRLSRRSFLKLGGLGLGAVGLSPLLQSCASPATPAVTEAAKPAPQNLKMWWWGEQEAPGLEKWLNDTIVKFKEETGHSIEPTLQDTAVVISEFQTASAANDAPDMQFLWNAIYHMETAWLGYLEPLNNLLSEDEIWATNPTVLSVYQGDIFRTGWYSASLLMLYNKEIFDKAGLNADVPPKTWDEYMAACDKLKTAGFIPMSAGLKDGFWGDWYFTCVQPQNLNTPAEVVDLFVGKSSWLDPKNYEGWSRLEELWKAGFLNDDMNSIDLYPGVELFGAGKAATTMLVTPLIGSQTSALGSSEKVGAMVIPSFGTGAMAGKAIADCQGFGISSQSEHKEVAAEFLRFMNTKERVEAVWHDSKALPVNDSFDPNIIEDPLMKEVWQTWVGSEDVIPYLGGLMPVLFWTDASFVNSQKVISGEWNGEQCGQNAQDVTNKWIEQNPDMVEKYTLWTEDLAKYKIQT